MSKDLQINDLVWAKMKGFPYWPGRIAVPPPDDKLKKNFSYVFFFGTENSAWVKKDCIEMHSNEVLEKYVHRKGPVFQKAIAAIVEHSNKQSFEAEIADTTEDETHREISSEMCEQNDEPSASGGPIFHEDNMKECVEIFDKLLDMGYEDEDKSKPVLIDPLYFSAPHSSCVIPHPDLMNYRELPVKEPYVPRPESPPFDFSKSKKLKQKRIIPSKKKIGFLGFTKMAKGIIKNLSLSGHCVVIWSENAKECRMFADKLQIKCAATPAAVVKNADITFSCFSDADEVKNLVFDTVYSDTFVLKEIEHSKRQKGYVEMTIIAPEASEHFANEIKMKGGLYIEAQCVSSNVEASDGTLYVHVAGDKLLYDDCKSCLDAISREHVYMSPEVGVAAKMNTVCNMFTGTVNVAVAECISLVEKQGLGKDFTELLKLSDLNSSFLVNKAEAMLSKNFETETSVKDMQKIFSSGMALGHQVSHSFPVFAMANEAYKDAIKKEYGEHDISAAIQATKP